MLAKHLSERFSPRALQGNLQDLTVLLLGTAVALGGTLLERANQLVWQVSDR